MATEENNCLQRQLADLITRLGNLNEIRLLIAQGANVNHPVCQGKFTKLLFKYIFFQI